MIREPALVEVLRLLRDGTPSTWHACLAHSGAEVAPLDALTQRMLADHGVEISLTSDGDATLQIAGPRDTLNANTILELLPSSTGAGVRKLEVVWTTDSTNLRLLENARVSSVDGHALAAEHQSAGRGRRGRQWLSPVASNLYLSIGVRLARAEQMQALSLIVGVAAADALGALGYAGIGIKWPNDLQCVGRKLAGILIESAGPTPEGIQLVIGIGINVRVPAYVGEQIDQPWIDLAQMTTTPRTRNEICAAVLAAITNALAEVRRGDGAQFFTRFAQYDVLRDKPITVHSADRQQHGIARGIDEKGELLVEYADGVRATSAGEVSIRLG